MTLQQFQQISSSNVSHEVEKGLDFIINHFDPTILYFPRTRSTRNLNYKQVEIFSKQEALQFFQQSNYIDCRINAFRSIDSTTGKWYPDFIFIDIDRAGSKTERSFKLGLSNTLKNIRENLNGEPTVLWSGNGYHIYQPIEGIIFENYEIFDEFNNDFDLFKEFLRFSKSYLSNGKSDPKFNPSLESCLLRIPGSLNGKFLENRDKRLAGNFRVKVFQKWNGVRAIVSDEFLEDFRIHLIDKKMKEIKENNNTNNNQHQKYYNSDCNYIPWIEQLLQTPIEEYRKRALWQILCPYLVNIKKLPNEESTSILKEWLSKCNSIRKLDFNPKDRIKNDLGHIGSYYPPGIKKIKTDPDYSELYKILQNKGAL